MITSKARGQNQFMKVRKIPIFVLFFLSYFLSILGIAFAKQSLKTDQMRLDLIKNIYREQNQESIYYSYLPVIYKFGHIYYVSPDGDDTNPGTFFSPWRTISKAARSVIAGDTVVIRGGVYNEQVRIEKSGTSDKPIIFIAYTGENPIIEGYNQIPGEGEGLISLNGDWIQVIGLEVRNSHNWGVVLYGKHNIVSDLRVHHSWRTGIYINGDYGTVQYSKVWRNSMRSENGIASVSSGIASSRDLENGITDYAVIRGNEVFENWGQGIDAYESNQVVIEGNIVHDNWTTNIYISDATNILCQRNFVYMNPSSIDFYGRASNNGIMIGDEIGPSNVIPPSSNITIINNIAYLNSPNLALWKGAQPISNINIFHNTFSNSNETAGVILKGYHTKVQFINNIVEQDNNYPVIDLVENVQVTFSNNLWSKNPYSSASGPGDVIGDPLFSHIGHPFLPTWYILSNSSPAINAALVIPQVAIDYFGDLRDQNPDIGADEMNP